MKKVMAYGAVAATALLAGARIYRELTRYEIRNKVVLITGGSRGLGFALARALAKRGARLALCARTADQLEKAKSELTDQGAEVIVFTTDVTKRREVQKLLRDVVKHYGQLDVLINNAGIIQVSPMEALNIDDFEKTMKTNFWASLYTMMASIPVFQNQGEGRIVNIASIGGKVAVPHLLPYTASKFALVGLSEGMHASLKKHNIKLTTVIPGLMRTGSPMNAHFKGGHDKEYAWFKIADSSAVLSVSADHAAQQIIKGLEYGNSEIVIGWTTRIATAMQGLLPGVVNILLSFTNQLLPDNDEGSTATHKGFEHESPLSKKWGMSSDKAAIANNQL